jgi:hypothetical protein
VNVKVPSALAWQANVLSVWACIIPDIAAMSS